VVEQGKWKVGCLLSNGNTKVLARRESPGNLAWIRYYSDSERLLGGCGSGRVNVACILKRLEGGFHVLQYISCTVIAHVHVHTTQLGRTNIPYEAVDSTLQYSPVH
jgi:hypothetical protein